MYISKRQGKQRASVDVGIPPDRWHEIPALPFQCKSPMTQRVDPGNSWNVVNVTKTYLRSSHDNGFGSFHSSPSTETPLQRLQETRPLSCETVGKPRATSESGGTPNGTPQRYVALYHFVWNGSFICLRTVVFRCLFFPLFRKYRIHMLSWEI